MTTVEPGVGPSTLDNNNNLWGEERGEDRIPQATLIRTNDFYVRLRGAFGGLPTPSPPPPPPHSTPLHSTLQQILVS
jgi:hypothetical protein